MKKIILISLTFGALNSVIAQVKIAAKGGWNFSSVNATYNGVKQPSEFTFGYGIGAMAKIPFDGVLNFSPSVMINKRGFIVNPLTGNNKEEQYSIVYLDLVPSLSVDFPIRDNFFIISFGPNFGLTNYGKLKSTDNNNVTTSEKLKFGYGGYGWFDLGLNASLGYHMKKVFVEVGYMHGLASINNNEEVDQRNIRNRMLGLNIGYYFR